jgi:hypothetical protein
MAAAFSPATTSVYRAAIMARTLGIIGAIAAVVYWRYTVSHDPLLHPASWTTVLWEGSVYAVVGFVIGWIVGFLLPRQD